MTKTARKVARRPAVGVRKTGPVGAIERAVKAMTPALRAEYEKLRKMLANSERQEVHVRHTIGLVVARVRGARAKYGSDAVGQLERALGLDENTLRRYERIATTWTAPQISTVLKRTNPYGRPLSWSHLDVLAEVTDAKKREDLLDQALRDGLSVRELAGRVRGRMLSVVEDASESAVRRPLLSAVREMTARAENVVVSASTWEKSVFAHLGQETSPEVNESLQKAKAVYMQLRGVCDEILGRIEQGLGNPGSPQATVDNSKG
jgi:hypothetical protein